MNFKRIIPLINFIEMIAVFAFSCYWFFSWLLWYNEWQSVSDCLIEASKVRFQFSNIFTVFFPIAFVASSSLLSIYLHSLLFRGKVKEFPLLVCFFYRVIFITLAIMFAIFREKWYDQFFKLQKFQMFMLPYGGPVIVMLLSVFLTPLALGLKKVKQERKDSFSGGVRFWTLFFMLICWLFSIGYVCHATFTVDRVQMVSESQTIPNKPKIISHRGDVQKFPENTMEGFRSALEDPSVDAIEFDISVSLDKKFYLMHDSNLTRTTNVDSARKSFPVNSFSWEDLQKLELENHYKIPLLDDVLLEMENYPSKQMMFDFRTGGLQNAWLILKEHIESKGCDSQVIWLNTDLLFDHIEPTLVAGDVDNRSLKLDPAAHGLNTINAFWAVPYNYMRSLKTKGIRIIAYVVDDPWLFSQLWLLGVDYVITNDFRAYKEMKQPIYFSEKSVKIYWIISATLFVVVIFIQIVALFKVSKNSSPVKSRAKIVEII